MALKIYDTLKPQGDYPAVNAADIEMEDGTRLPEALETIKASGYVVQTEPPEDTRMLWLDLSDTGGNTSGNVTAVLNEIDALIGGDE